MLTREEERRRWRRIVELQTRGERSRSEGISPVFGIHPTEV